MFVELTIRKGRQGALPGLAMQPRADTYVASGRVTATGNEAQPPSAQASRSESPRVAGGSGSAQLLLQDPLMKGFVTGWKLISVEGAFIVMKGQLYCQKFATI